MTDQEDPMNMYEGTPDQNLRAEVRAVEDGHQARLNDDGSLSVKSSTHPDVTYTVRFWAVLGRVLWSCNCPAGTYKLMCKHAARAARRLERESIVRWENGHWMTTAKVDALMEAAKPAVQQQPADPYEGLS